MSARRAGRASESAELTVVDLERHGQLARREVDLVLEDALRAGKPG